MIYTKDDIHRLVSYYSTREEEAVLSGLLGYDVDDEDIDYSVGIVRQYWWTYQTPLGYLTRNPTFDEICLDVAKKLKLEGLSNEECTCWELLERIVRSLWEQMINDMSEEQKQDLANKLLSDSDLKDVAEKARADFSDEIIQWDKMNKATLGSVLLGINQYGGFATYKIAVIVANQLSRAFLGKGLAFATNALLTKTVSIILGPIGWLLLAWGVNDLLGTNYKKLIPATIYIYCIYSRVKFDGQLPDGF